MQRQMLILKYDSEIKRNLENFSYVRYIERKHFKAITPTLVSIMEY